MGTLNTSGVEHWYIMLRCYLNLRCRHLGRKLLFLGPLFFPLFGCCGRTHLLNQHEVDGDGLVILEKCRVFTSKHTPFSRNVVLGLGRNKWEKSCRRMQEGDGEGWEGGVLL